MFQGRIVHFRGMIFAVHEVIQSIECSPIFHWVLLYSFPTIFEFCWWFCDFLRAYAWVVFVLFRVQIFSLRRCFCRLCTFIFHFRIPSSSIVWFWVPFSSSYCWFLTWPFLLLFSSFTFPFPCRDCPLTSCRDSIPSSGKCSQNHSSSLARSDWSFPRLKCSAYHLDRLIMKNRLILRIWGELMYARNLEICWSIFNDQFYSLRRMSLKLVPLGCFH